MAAVGTIVLVSALGVMLAGSAGAQSLPFCGGQNAPPQPVPYTCRTQTQTIDGSQVSAVLHADGTTVTVTYTLLAPRPTDAPIRITHHIGISGAGGTRSVANGVIPAGQTTATLSVTTPCFAGQVDIKFVFVLGHPTAGSCGWPLDPERHAAVHPAAAAAAAATTARPPPPPPTTTATTAATTVHHDNHSDDSDDAGHERTDEHDAAHHRRQWARRVQRGSRRGHARIVARRHRRRPPNGRPPRRGLTAAGRRGPAPRRPHPWTFRGQRAPPAQAHHRRLRLSSKRWLRRGPGF